MKKGCHIELPDFELLKRQPDPPHVARPIATRDVANEHGAIVRYTVHESRRGKDWWISASYPGSRGKNGAVYAGMRASNTLHTSKPEKAKAWIDAVNSGKVCVKKT